MKKNFYKTLPHPADICVEVYGKNIKELFLNSALALVSELGRVKKRTGARKKNLRVNGIDRESLLINWLQELLYNFYVQGLIFRDGKIKKLTGKELVVDVNFVKFTPQTFQPLKEIKAVTHHDVHITRNNNNFSVKIVFDI
jgi:SHS2 domain-containing protein